MDQQYDALFVLLGWAFLSISLTMSMSLFKMSSELKPFTPPPSVMLVRVAAFLRRETRDELTQTQDDLTCPWTFRFAVRVRKVSPFGMLALFAQTVGMISKASGKLFSYVVHMKLTDINCRYTPV